MGNPAIDLIIRIKNGYMARREEIYSPYSVFREELLKRLKELGFVKNYEVTGDKIKRITISLLYKNGEPAVSSVEIYSKPGRRYYVSYRHLKPILGGFGFSLLSTSKGILTNKEAHKLKLGGELLFNIW